MLPKHPRVKSRKVKRLNTTANIVIRRFGVCTPKEIWNCLVSTSDSHRP